MWSGGCQTSSKFIFALREKTTRIKCQFQDFVSGSVVGSIFRKISPSCYTRLKIRSFSFVVRHLRKLIHQGIRRGRVNGSCHRITRTNQTDGQLVVISTEYRTGAHRDFHSTQLNSSHIQTNSLIGREQKKAWKWEMKMQFKVETSKIGLIF